MSTQQMPEATTGSRLRSAREKAGLTQQQLAERMNSTKTAVSNAERDRPDQKRSIKWLLRASAALGIAGAELLPELIPEFSRTPNPKRKAKP